MDYQFATALLVAINNGKDMKEATLKKQAQGVANLMNMCTHQ